MTYAGQRIVDLATRPAVIFSSPLIENSSHLATPFIRYSKFGSPEFDVEPIDQTESEFRHGSWAAQRQIVWQALKSTGTSDAALSRFANCGSGLWLELNPADQEVRLRCNKCRNRWCVRCQHDRACKIAENVQKLVDMRCTRFVTFTLRHSATPLNDQINRLLNSFALLRRRQSWKENVTGGSGFLEVKLSEKDGLWHVHLHCLTQGQWWDQREIAREWHAVTGDSFIVDVTLPRDEKRVVGYVTKYVTKPLHESLYSDLNKLQEAMIALRGRKCVIKFGSWYGQDLEPEEKTDVQWKPIGKLSELLSKARNGEAFAVRWIEVAQRKWPNLESLILYPFCDTS